MTAGHIARWLLGKPRDPLDPSTRRTVLLAALMAWAGLGANGLSAACYGPEKAFLALGEHTALGPLLALVMVASVVVVALAYSQMFELFPNGGGSYRVASQLLGPRLGLVSGAALLVDYVLAIAVSIASGTDALFSLGPAGAQPYKLPVELAAVAMLVWMNLRGMHAAIRVLLPIAVGFLVIHGFLIVNGIALKAPDLPAESAGAFSGALQLSRTSGWTFVLALMVRAYGLGGSTYTGVEAVSNNVNLLAQPRIRTGRLTMLYVATTLAATAGGLMLLYSLWGVQPGRGQTLNAAVFAAVLSGLHLGDASAQVWLLLALGTEAAILLVAANSVLIFAPSLLANMALDSWLPHRFRNLSLRLVRQNGVVFIGACALAILAWTGGQLGVLVVFYSINVFLSLALAKAGLLRHWWDHRHTASGWLPRMVIAALGLVLASGILLVTLTERFFEGGWATVCLTLMVIGVCMLVRRHYAWVGERRTEMDGSFALTPAELQAVSPVPPQPGKGTAILLATEHWGPAIHALLWVQRLFPAQFANIVFLRVIEVDAASMGALDTLASRTEKADAAMAQLEGFCAMNGLSARHVVGCGADPVEELERLIRKVATEAPDCVCFANKLILPPGRRIAEWLHNQTAFGLQRRLHEQGIPLVILPIKLGW